MAWQSGFGKLHQFRLVLCGHKAAEAGAVCLVLMVEGHLADITAAHLLIAAKTGLLAVSPAVVVTFTSYVRHFANRWAAAAFLAICTFAADAVIHGSHYSGEYTEAGLTAIGAGVLSLAIASTPFGKRIDALVETAFHPQATQSARA